MMELIAVAFPGFFRSGTINMGKYLGIRQQGALVAMAGERLSISGYREISGVCTHPDHTGRGYARRLISILIHDILTRGLTPFLHFVSGNERASLLYKKLGFTVHSEIAMARVRRQF
jgi:predicted GNAT family acetyltransferase